MENTALKTSQNRVKPAHLKDYFSKPFIVMDTEFTSWEGAMARDWSGPNEWRELVQIAAVEIDPTQGFKETAHFDVLVKPQWNPQLSDYFKDLTAIRQEDVDADGLMFSDAAAQFAKFVGEKDVWSYGGDEKIFYENCVFYNAEFKPNCAFYDARLIVRLMGDNPEDYSSGTLYKAVGINMDGHVHNALHDCRSVVQYLKHHFS